MYLAVSFLFLGVYIVSSGPMKKSYSTQEPADLNFQDNVEFQDDFLIRKEQVRKCEYKGKEHENGEVVKMPAEPDDNRCYRCTCIRGNWRCQVLRYCKDLQCDEYEFPVQAGGCCPGCKKISCEGREVGDQWVQDRVYTGKNKGNCTTCKCTEARGKYCRVDKFECFPEGCQEMEKPYSCCPECSVLHEANSLN